MRLHAGAKRAIVTSFCVFTGNGIIGPDCNDEDVNYLDQVQINKTRMKKNTNSLDATELGQVNTLEIRLKVFLSVPLKNEEKSVEVEYICYERSAEDFNIHRADCN